LSKSATVTVTRAITVAAGPYAPGHLGELTQVIPFELVDAVLEETGTVQQRLRDLPSRVGVYLLLAMGLFEQVGVGLVWSKLVAGLSGLSVADVSEKALRDLRRRIGPAPLKALFQVLAGPLAQPRTPGVCYRGMRTVAFDGCLSIRVPDSMPNRWRFGKHRHARGTAGYPVLRLVALVETGTRAVVGAVFGPRTSNERALAGKLMPHLGLGMLVLADRGFDGDDVLRQIAKTGAQLLVRARSSRRPQMLQVLDDGSYLARIGGLTLRVIEARISVRTADGSTISDTWRLLTTLTDHRLDPAPALIKLYHERWEVETAFLALRHTMLAGRVLRSKDPAGIAQEVWALLALYQAIRTVMVDAAESVPGCDPDRIPFTVAVQAARDSVVAADNVITDTTDLVGDIGRAALAKLLPARRPRISERKVKSPLSRYHQRPATGRPSISSVITSIDIVICEPTTGPASRPAPAKPRHRPRKRRDDARPARPAKRPTTTEPPAPPPDRPPAPSPIIVVVMGGDEQSSGRWPIVKAIMHTDPGRSWHAAEIATHISGINNLRSFCTQMSQWASKGLLRKTAPATYELAETTP
jgi:Insertion element 4 transposase N-terminal/Transposase DDE domain